MWWGPTLLLMGVIWWLSSSARTPGPPLPHPLDWAAHFVAYLALGFCLARATGRWQLAWVLAAWFGALDEVHQAFVPPREAGISDWIFDALGAFVGARLAARLGVPKPALRPIELNFEDDSEVWPSQPSEPHEKGVTA